MKNLNLIERLWTDSHEKQTPQRFRRYAGMLLMLFTIGVGQMWGWSATIYFAPGEVNPDYDSWTTCWANVYKGSWANMQMTNTGLTYNGHKLFSVYYGDASIDGARKIEFHESENDWDPSIVAHDGDELSTSSFDNKLWNGSSWVDVIKYIYGNGNGNWLNGQLWIDNAASNMIVKGSTRTYTSCAPGIKSFRLKGSSTLGYSNINVAGSNVTCYTNEDNNICFSTVATADITIGYDDSGISINVTYSDLASTLNAILNNSKIMFYYGDNWNTDCAKYLHTTTPRDNHYSSVSIHINDRRLAVAIVNPSVRYWVVNDGNWDGLQMTQNAKRGGRYTLYSDNGDQLDESDGVLPSWTTSSSTITEGDASCSLAATCNNSVIGRSQTISYYYTTDTDNGSATWTEFDPSDVDDLSAGTYTVRALAFDGNIYVRTEIAATLTVNAAAANYTINYGVDASGHGTLAATYTSGGSSIGSSPATVTASSGVTFTADPDDYYEVDAWYTNSACNTGKHDEGETEYAIASVTSDDNVYVKFKLIDYDITYHLDGGSNHASNPDSYTYETASITLQNPTRDGYTFGGWWTTSTFDTGTQKTSIPNHSDGDVELYAKWTEVKVAISPTVNSLGTAQGYTASADPSSIGIETTAVLTADAPGEGYIFNTWDLSSNLVCVSGSLSSRTITVRTNGDGNSVTAEAQYAVDDSVRLYLNNVCGWGTPKAYVWKGSDDSDNNNDWSGIEMSQICGNYYVYSFKRSEHEYWDQVIFNDNGGTKTSDLDIEGHNGMCYNNSTDKWEEFKLETTFYFVNTEFWDEEDVHLYHWNSGTYFGDWPGVQMDKMGKVTIDGHEYDYYGIADGLCNKLGGNFIVNDGKGNTSPERKQTSDFENIKQYFGKFFVADECFGAGASVKPDGTWYDSDGVHSATIGCPALLPFADINTINLSASKVPPMATITATPVMNNKRAVDQAYCWAVYSDEECTSPVNVSFTSLGAGKVQFTVPQTIGTYYLKLTVRASAACDASIDDEEVQSFNVTTDNMVFFKNVPNWGSVHVYFLGASEYWNPDKGTGCQGRDLGHAYGMTRIGNSDVYYYDYTGNSNAISGYIAFTDNYKPNSEFFSGCQAAYRGDFDRTCAPMYVPENYITDYKNTSAGDGQAAYYNRGYWTKYMNTGSAYTLHVYTLKDEGSEVFSHEFTGTVGSNTYSYTYDFKDVSESMPYIYYMTLVGCNGSTYGATDDMDISKCTNWNFYTQTRRCGLKVQGKLKHTFILTLTGDGHIQLSVEYPVTIGDYRLVYDDDTQTPHPSQYIRKRANGKDTISMFVRTRDAIHPTLKVQSCTGISGETITWEDYNWNSGSAAVSLTGLDTAGVYNFYLEQDGEGNLTVNTTETKPYSGRYYIRTSSVDGGWMSYENTPDNRLTYAQYPYDKGYGFNYYKAKWIGSTGTDVTFTIANDYSESLCDTMVADPGDNPLNASQARSIPHSASVRFGWNSKTNKMTRAYINGSSIVSDRYLVMIGDEKMKDKDGYALAISGLNANEMNFTDLNNWIYRADITAVEGAKVKLTANYDSYTQYFIGTAEEGEEILGGNSGKQYLMRVTYDFKTNRLMTAWLPNGDAITDDITLKADMMLIREGQNAATQVYFGEGKKDKAITEVKTIFGAMEFQYDKIAGKFPNWSAANAYKYLMYYISFPFDVKVSEIFGTGVRGENWIIQKYNGQKRAEIGWFAETSTFWETLPGDSTLHANEGYLLLLDRVSFNDPTSAIWTNLKSGNSVYLYFPSVSRTIGTISDQDQTITVPSHVCNINRTFTPAGGGGEVSHKNTDSHWNIMGTPLFETQTATIGTPVAGGGDETLHYFYRWDASDNHLDIETIADTTTFKSMHSYMVQYAGNVTFHGAAINPPASVAARRLPGDKNYQIELQMVNESGKTSRTYVELRENACDTFALNEDMYMMRSSKMVDLYSFAGNYDVAANVLSVNNHIVPVGMDVKVADTYRFTMSSEFDGSVVLMDTYTGARTNLALGDYEVNLERGTANDRFLLEINIHNAPTTIEGIEGGSLKDGKAHKFVQDGVMYILRDGKLFDARGAMVK